MRMSPGNLWAGAKNGEGSVVRETTLGGLLRWGRAILFDPPSSEMPSCFPSCCLQGLLRTCSVCFGGGWALPTKLLFFPPDCFFPSEGRRAGSLVAAWRLAGCHEGWEKGGGWEAKISCPGGWWFCLLALQRAWVCRARICVGRKWRSLVPSLTLLPLWLMGSQHDEFKYREASGS